MREWRYSLPEAVIATKRAAGRLIKAEDRGRFGALLIQVSIQAMAARS